MQKIIRGSLIGIITLMLAGCGAAATEIREETQTGRADVFCEIRDAGVPPRGFADLTVRATIKTHLEGYYALESKNSLHGKAGYPFLITVDGQAETWKIDGQRENVPLCGPDGKTSRDPDAGEGIRYVLEKKIRLRAGTHKISLGMPEDGYFKEGEIRLEEGETSVLEFMPVYKYKTLPVRIPAFRRGIKEFEVRLNGERLSWRAGPAPPGLTCTRRRMFYPAEAGRGVPV